MIRIPCMSVYDLVLVNAFVLIVVSAVAFEIVSSLEFVAAFVIAFKFVFMNQNLNQILIPNRFHLIAN